MAWKNHFFAGVLTITIVVALFPVLLQGFDQKSTTPLSSERIDNVETQRSLIVGDLSGMPLSFTENRGQWDDQALFKANAGGTTMWFTRGGTYYQFTRHIPHPESSTKNFGGRQMSTAPPGAGIRGRQMSTSAPGAGIRGRQMSTSAPGDVFDHRPDSFETMAIKTSFVGANSNPEVVGEGLLEYKCNYFIGNDPTEWQTDVPNYQAVCLKDVYPGIDLRYYGNGRQLEYDFVVIPGADPTQIQLEYEGVNSISVNTAGELVIETDWTTVTEQKPKIYQLINGEQKQIEGRYNLLSSNSFSFQLGKDYDPHHPLVIDPVVLVYSTYLGGGGPDAGYGIAVDGSGNAYVTGYTYSSDFPTTTKPYQPTHAGGRLDVFVTKLNSAGNGLEYSTYLGGDDQDDVNAIAVDRSGNAYVTGYTYSSNFPTQNPYQPTHAGGLLDVFVTKLNSAGNGLEYSTYLGGDDYDSGRAIAVDGNGNAYVTGFTYSSDFPTIDSHRPGILGGYYDAFVTKLNAAGNGLVYSTYLGGGGPDAGYGIAVDGSGNAYVTGGTESDNFPTQNPYQGEHAGGDYDVFVTKLNNTGDGLVYSTYLGGEDVDEGHAIAVDGSGNAYVTGWTLSSNFPTQNPYQTDQPDSDVFVTKLNSAGNGLVYSTYLGGEGDDEGGGIAVDGNGNAYVTGGTLSSNFPTEGPYQTDQPGADVFVTKLNSAGIGIMYSTYLGGDGDEGAHSIAVDGSGNAYVTGSTLSSNFPTQNPFQTYLRSIDAFVTKLALDPGTGILEESESQGLAGFTLYQNHPNPFNASTIISFETQRPGPVKLEIFNILGQRVFQRHLDAPVPGSHTFNWNGVGQNGARVPSGMYFYRISANGMTQSRKMLLLK